MEDKELTTLIEKAQAGDQGAMEVVLQKAHTPVSYQCRKLLRDPRDAEDMTQEVLLLVYTRLSLLKNPAAFWGWLNSITINRCMNALKRTHVELQFAEDEEGHSVLDDLEELDEQQVPDKALDNTETTRMIEEIVSSLPEAQRICTMMYYYDEMSVREIAEAVGVPENTVKSRLNYARKAIKERVLDYEKQGVKLYGLSPLPFLLYFLGRSADESADAVQAGAAARQVMASVTGTVSAAAAGGTSAAIGNISGEAVSTVGTAAAGTAAGGTASAAGTAAAHVLGGLSVKAFAGVLAGALVVGGIVGTVALVNREDEPEPSPSVSETLPAEDETASPSPSFDPPQSPTPTESISPMGLIPEDPGPPDSPYNTETVYDPNTYISRTTLVGGPANLEVYYEIPVLPETTEGVKLINAYFREERDRYFRDENGSLGRTIEAARVSFSSDPLYDTNRCTIETLNDEIVSVTNLQNLYTGGATVLGGTIGHTFRADTGEQMNLLELLGCPAEELRGIVAQALAADGITDWEDPYGDPAQYPFYLSDGTLFVGVNNIPMYSGTYFVTLDVPFHSGGSAQADPAAELNSIAYYGDPSQCRMASEQAGAFAEVIETETAALRVGQGLSGEAEEVTAYAALIDIGEGKPILVYAGGVRGDGPSANPSLKIDDTVTVGIWQYIDGGTVYFNAPLRFVRWDGDTLCCPGGLAAGPDNYFDANIYGVEGGILSETPVSSISWSSGSYFVDGQPDSGSKYNAIKAHWSAYEPIGLFETGAGQLMWYEVAGMTPAEDVLAVLEKF